MTRRVILTFAAAVLLAPAAAQASPTQQSIMMDDDLLVYRDGTTANKALSQMKSLGVDTVRVTVLWEVVARDARFTPTEILAIRKKKGRRAATAARLQSKRFRAENPKTYPRLNWDRYDNLVLAATRLGLRVYFNITGPGPRWAHEKPPRSQANLRRTYKPKPSAFKQFVTAVGRRYSGRYRDENGSGVLPRVSFWSLWNEPNQAGWLSPQWDRVGSKRVPVAPALFRKLYLLGYKGLVKSGHTTGTDTVLLGETAPLGSSQQASKTPLYPVVFLRELMCIKPDGTKYTGAAAKLRSCGDFAKYGQLQATGFAHHPYTKNVPTSQPPPTPEALTMANISTLGTLLDSLSDKTGGNIPKNLPLYMTEFGFETNPPDPYSGVPLANQALYNVLGEFIAWQNPRIASQAQFLLRDVPPVANRTPGTKGYWFTYQSGLFTQNGTAKPAAFAYQLPLLLFRSGTDVGTGLPINTFWGQLRFLPDGVPATGPNTAIIQWKPQGAPDSAFADLGAPIPVDAKGYFNVAITAPQAGPIVYRAGYRAPGAAFAYPVSLSQTG